MNLKDITQSLKDSGYKLTPQRIAIIKVMLSFDKPVSASKAHQKLKEHHPNVSLDTIYRSLHLLSSLGIVTQINLANRERELFELAHHHHHLVCLKCGKVICFDACPMSCTETEEIAVNQNFSIVSHAFEVYGYCSNCK
ncbi:Fe2+ or Zn2+ uptake regulation protein [Desulfitispora alkaliphila]|uniref:Fur family transcriptional regulator n=1 Tax=Desulfitispora alkaliphila TaxID=622674 RepID=UPI003D1E956D